MNNMTLKEAIDILTKWVEVDRNMRDYPHEEDDYDRFCEEKNVAVDTILRAIKIKDGYLDAICFLLADTRDCETRDDVEELIVDACQYAYMGIKNDDKSVISFNDKKNFNILHEEVQDE